MFGVRWIMAFRDHTKQPLEVSMRSQRLSVLLREFRSTVSRRVVVTRGVLSQPKGDVCKAAKPVGGVGSPGDEESRVPTIAVLQYASTLAWMGRIW